jgi:creatinine amidohydrolase
MEEYDESEVFACPLYSGPSEDKIEEIRDKGPEGSGHAGETETSIVMALNAALVKEDRLDADGQRAKLALTGVVDYRRMDRRTSHGGVGDPTSATPEKGERLLQEIVKGLEDVVLKIRSGAGLYS